MSAPAGPIVRRNPDVAWRDEPTQKEVILSALARGEDVTDRGWVILVDGGQMVELNLLAGEIWCLLDGSRAAGDVIRELAEQFEAPVEEIRADVEVFIADCVKRGWLTEEPV